MSAGPGTPAAQAATIRAEVIETLEQSYYRPLTPEALRADNLRGVLGALDDPYTEYLPPAAYRQLADRASSRATPASARRWRPPATGCW